MSLNWGKPASPQAFIRAVLLPLGKPVAPVLDENTPLPCYVLSVVAGKSDRLTQESVVSVHSFAPDAPTAPGWGAAEQLAYDADHAILSVTAGDVFTLADSTTASASTSTQQAPIWVDFHDPSVKRYVARYNVELRFT